MADMTTRIDQYRQISVALFIFGVVLLALAIIFFFRFRIYRLFDRITGHGTKKEKEKIEKRHESQKHTGYTESVSEEQDDSGDLLDEIDEDTGLLVDSRGENEVYVGEKDSEGVTYDPSKKISGSGRYDVLKKNATKKEVASDAEDEDAPEETGLLDRGDTEETGLLSGDPDETGLVRDDTASAPEEDEFAETGVLNEEIPETGLLNEKSASPSGYFTVIRKILVTSGNL